jgi:hypothetical protein
MRRWRNDKADKEANHDAFLLQVSETLQDTRR